MTIPLVRPHQVQYQQLTEPIPPTAVAAFDPATSLVHAEYPAEVRSRAPLNVEALTKFAYVSALNRWGIDTGEPPLAFYPDFPGRRSIPLNADSLTSIAYVPALGRWGIDTGEPPLAFYPDVLPGRGPVPLNVEALTKFAYVSALNRWGIDTGEPPLAFYPDRIDRKTSGEEEWRGYFAFLPDLASFALPAPLVWQGWSPNQILRLPELVRVGENRVDFTAALIPPFDPTASIAWRGEWPDFARGRVPLNSESLTWFAYVSALNRWGIDTGEPPLAFYPDFPGRRSIPLNADSLTSFAYVPALSRWGIDTGEPPLAFYPDFPGRGPAPLNANSLTWFAYVSALNRWGIDTGEPPLAFYPDRIDRKTSGEEEWRGYFAFLPDLASFALPAPLVWQPNYPDFARGRVPLNSESLTWFAYVSALNRWGIDTGEPPLAFYPDFPGRGRVPLNVDSLTSFAYIPALARWGLDKGETPWIPVYPEFPGRSAPDGNRWMGASIWASQYVILPAPPLSWAPIFPNFIWAPARSFELLRGYSYRPDAPAFVQYEAILLYDTTKNPSSTRVYFEAVLAATAGTASARLMNITDGTAVAGSDISTTSSIATRVRSAALTMPTGAKEYRADAGMSVGGSGNIYAARLIVEIPSR